MEPSYYETFLGGSSFNAIHSLSSMNQSFRLGYVGVSGFSGIPGMDFHKQFKQFHIDSQFVSRASKLRAGVCISYIDEDERSLLTFPGANTQMADFLSENYKEILDYITQSKIIHLTSFFDNRTPIVLSKLLKDAKNKNPWLKLSFDPGHHWTKSPSSKIKKILKYTDILFLNNLNSLDFPPTRENQLR